MAQLIPHIESVEFKDFIEETLALWHVPGLALAVIQDDQTVLCEGYGLRNIERGLPVTPDTLFPIASCTKAFTTLALGILVDQGKLDWDRPFRQYLPDFQLWDPVAAERLTPRDLLCHRSGLPGHDMVWYGSNFDRRALFRRLRFLEPSCDFRSKFQYSNIMFAIAGLLVEEIAGMSWEDFVQQRIFNPLDMSRSNFSTRITQQADDYASPYYYHEGALKAIPFQSQDAQHGTGPSGAVCSCASDMAKWLNFHLNHGRIGEQALVSETILAEMHTPQIFIDDPTARKRYGFEFASYGLGWAMHSHRGQFLVEHDGQTDGFYVLASFLPRHRLGVIALSNADSYYHLAQENLVPNIVAYTLYDRLLGLEPTDWNGLMTSAHDERESQVQQYFEMLAALSPKITVPPSHPLQDYLGEYEHPGYGRISIRLTGDQLRMVFNDKLSLPLEHSYYDIFEVVFEMNGQRQKMAFLTDLDGKIDRAACPLEPMVKEIIFTRIPSSMKGNGSIG